MIRRVGIVVVQEKEERFFVRLFSRIRARPVPEPVTSSAGAAVILARPSFTETAVEVWKPWSKPNRYLGETRPGKPPSDSRRSPSTLANVTLLSRR